MIIWWNNVRIGGLIFLFFIIVIFFKWIDVNENYNVNAFYIHFVFILFLKIIDFLFCFDFDCEMKLWKWYFPIWVNEWSEKPTTCPWWSTCCFPFHSVDGMVVISSHTQCFINSNWFSFLILEYLTQLYLNSFTFDELIEVQWTTFR